MKICFIVRIKEPQFQTIEQSSINLFKLFTYKPLLSREAEWRAEQPKSFMWRAAANVK